MTPDAAISWGIERSVLTLGSQVARLLHSLMEMHSFFMLVRTIENPRALKTLAD